MEIVFGRLPLGSFLEALIAIRQIFYEGNKAADFLANYGCSVDKSFIFNSAFMPHKHRGIVNLDRLGTPSIYVR